MFFKKGFSKSDDPVSNNVCMQAFFAQKFAPLDTFFHVYQRFFLFQISRYRGGKFLNEHPVYFVIIQCASLSRFLAIFHITLVNDSSDVFNYLLMIGKHEKK